MERPSLRRTLGRYVARSRTIELSRAASLNDTKEIVTHEAAHAAVLITAGESRCLPHGPEWRSFMARAGFPEARPARIVIEPAPELGRGDHVPGPEVDSSRAFGHAAGPQVFATSASDAERERPSVDEVKMLSRKRCSMGTTSSRLTSLVAFMMVAACNSGSTPTTTPPATVPTTPVTYHTQSFSSVGVVEVVADSAAVSPISVTNFAGTITHVEVTVDIESLVGTACEWSIGVSHPDGSGAGLMYVDTPSCQAAIQTSFPTQTVPYRSLDVLNGKPAEGQWELTFGIDDGSYRDPVPKRIRLNQWTLTITVQR